MKHNSKTRFSNRVANYIKYRPTYPKTAIDYLADRGMTSQSVVADIGSGTGIFSELIIQDVKTLIAVEPNPEMRHEAEQILNRCANYQSLGSSAEHTTLADQSLDFITVAQAFHWFDRDSVMKEFRRILKKDGLLVLIWNNRMKNTPFLKEYDTLLEKYGTDYKEINHQNLSENELEDLFSHDYHYVHFPNFQEFDLDGFKGRVFSSSYTPSPDQPGYHDLNNELERLYLRYQEDGIVRFNYQTDVYSGQILR